MNNLESIKYKKEESFLFFNCIELSFNKIKAYYFFIFLPTVLLATG